MKSKSVKINEIVIDGGTQQREKIDLDVVEEYAENMRCGAKFPAVSVFFDGAQYWLADGFHRYHASKEAEFLDMLCEVHEGTNRDALLFSAGANMAHGLRLSNVDKRRSVMVLINDSEWTKWSDRQIAIHCKVSNVLVSKIRGELLGGVKKENRVLTVNTLTPKPAREGDLAFQKTQVPEQIPENPDKKYDPAADDLAEAHDTIRALSDENDGLKDAIAVSRLPMDEMQSAADTIAELREKVRTLEIVNSSITKARDQYMRENAELKKQVAAQVREIKKLKK